MFGTMHAFLFFFFPVLTLILLGILFEEKLIAFESRVLSVLFHKAPAQKRSAARPAPVSRPAPALHRVERSTRDRQRNHRAA
ncbi:MAG: hypothetical protein IKN72_00360 [Clostridia bacterium]|nr:hypothetical protein [Clostridia bacterium]MBR3551824.1 hypothetical protein [Clostridia bacterium]